MMRPKLTRQKPTTKTALRPTTPTRTTKPMRTTNPTRN